MILKKLVRGVALFLVSLSCLMQVSCTFMGLGDVHKHSYSSAIFEYDDQHHWRVCDVEFCDQESEREAHEYIQVVDDEYRVKGEYAYYVSCGICGRTGEETFIPE